MTGRKRLNSGGAFLLSAVVLAVPSAFAQQGVLDSVKVFHPAGPMPSYDVTTIKKPVDLSDRDAAYWQGFSAAAGGPPTVRLYIQGAFGIPLHSGARLIGGPAWIGSEPYIIQGKAPDEIRDAMQKMSLTDQRNENRMMQQMLLQERFKLKVHFEMREMPVYELMPAKSGLKIKQVPPPPAGPVPRMRAGEPPPPGMLRLGIGAHPEIIAMAITMPAFINLLVNQDELVGRPVVDKTGFSGNFDVPTLKWTSSQISPELAARFNGSASLDEVGESLFTSLEQTLGMKLVQSKGMVEVVVIDGIEKPTEN